MCHHALQTSPALGPVNVVSALALGFLYSAPPCLKALCFQTKLRTDLQDGGEDFLLTKASPDLVLWL